MECQLGRSLKCKTCWTAMPGRDHGCTFIYDQQTVFVVVPEMYATLPRLCWGIRCHYCANALVAGI